MKKDWIMPKHSANPKELIAALEVYEEAKTWLDNDKYISKVKEKLSTSQESQAYTKKTQILTYFGFIEYQNNKEKRSAKKISKSGKEFLEAINKKNEKRIFELILESLETRIFGKNVPGLSSNSFIDPPKLFVHASIELGYLTLNEFGFLLDQLQLSHEDLYYQLIQDIRKNRLNPNKRFEISNKAKDPKPITAMKNWGFIEETGSKKGKLSVSQKFVDNYFNRLYALEPFNNAKVLQIKKPKEDLGNFLDYEIPNYSDLPPEQKKEKEKHTNKNKNKNKNSRPTLNIETGIQGENYVYKYEVNKLKKHGRDDLAKKVVKQCEDKTCFPGYDIKSFDIDGNEIYIEVKSSKSMSKKNFYISSNEIKAAKKYKKNYFIYRVVNSLTNPKIPYRIPDPLKRRKEGQIKIEPHTYEISFFN